MEEIYRQEGAPVRVQIIKPQTFSARLIYQAALKGMREASAYASFGGRIEKIYFKVGDYVKKDQVVMSFPTETPATQYNQAKVAYENAEKNMKRMDKLYSNGGVSQQMYDNVRAQYEVAKANWETVRQMVQVKAPISGIITRMDVTETDNVQKKAELFTVSQTGKLKAKIWIGEKDICDVHPGLPAVAVWHNSDVRGRVKQVDASVNPKRQAFGVVLEFDDPGQAMACGATADIRITNYEKDNAIVVPRKNILREAGKTFVYVVHNGLAKKQQVKLGRTYGMDVEVLSGLSAGDSLIAEGQLLLADSSKIKIIE